MGARDTYRLRGGEKLGVTAQGRERLLQPGLETRGRRSKPAVERLARGVDDAVQPIMQAALEVQKHGANLVTSEGVGFHNEEMASLDGIIGTRVCARAESTAAGEISHYRPQLRPVCDGSEVGTVLGFTRVKDVAYPYGGLGRPEFKPEGELLLRRPVRSLQWGVLHNAGVWPSEFVENLDSATGHLTSYAVKKMMVDG